MTRSMTLVCGVFACALLALPAAAPPQPKKLTPEERKELEAKWEKAMSAGTKVHRAGKYPEATTAFEEALAIARKLYPKDDFPDGHAALAVSLYNLGIVYKAQWRLAEAAPLLKGALDIFKRLFKGDHPAVATSLNNLASLYQDQGKWAEAAPLYEEALDVLKRLFKGDHPNLAASLNNLGLLYKDQGKLADAAPLLQEALDMQKRLHKGDHPDVALGLNNLGMLYRAPGKLADAAPLLKEALDMQKRLFKGDHANLAASLSNLGLLYQDQGKLAEAGPLLKEALDMDKRLHKGDYPNAATALNNLGLLYKDQGKLADAAPLLKEALDMKKRLHKGDHPDVALGLNNLGMLYRAQGKLADAAPLLQEALDMKKRLFKGDHPAVALGLNNLGRLYQDLGKPADAAPILRDALDMQKRLALSYAKQKSEGEVLTFTSTQQLSRDAYLSVARSRVTEKYDPASAYPAVWATKGLVARVYEQRQAQAGAAAVDPALAKQLDALADTRRRRADLLLARATRDPATLKQHEADLKNLDAAIAKFDESLLKSLPAVARLDKLDKATAADLQKALPADAALVDCVRYVFFEWDGKKPAGKQEKQTPCYLAFVVTRDKVTWVELDTEDAIKPAVSKWREAIVGDKEVPAALGKKVRALVWDKVRKALPDGTKTVYVCPDADLCRLPFAALPGDKPNTILLEDFALATVPHAPFLLDQLWPQDKAKNPPSGTLVVGGVKYDADIAAKDKIAAPLLKPDQKLAWAFLKGTVAEADSVAKAAGRKKLTVARLDADKATAAAVLDALPKAKVAHFATHGFFADPSFRGVFQLDEKDYQQSLRGERIGRMANSPLLMTGLVFAGANNPKTPGRGILTGEALIDRDLSGLELAVLSACETGLGDLGGGGEGVFGLQRAFHYAGTRNVVASLWKVDDMATAALMGEFYRHLWEKDQPPLEALRQAQLAVYRADPKQFGEMAARGLGVGTKDLKGIPVLPADAKDAKAGNRPALWAAFTLSGLGR